VISNDVFPENEENHENFVIFSNSFSKRWFFSQKMKNNTTIFWFFWISFQKMKNNTKKLLVFRDFLAIFKITITKLVTPRPRHFLGRHLYPALL
jgi:hypothetical protein